MVVLGIPETVKIVIMSNTKEKIKKMMQQDAVEQRREELSLLNMTKKQAKEKEHIPMDVKKKAFIYRLLFIFLLLFGAIVLFYGASISKDAAEADYLQQIKTKAQQELNLLVQQSNQILMKKIKLFNSIIQNKKEFKHFSEPAFQQELIADLQARLGEEAVIKLVNADFTDDEIIDDPELGYGILFMLNELKASAKNEVQHTIKIEAHGINSDDSHLIFIKKVSYTDNYTKEGVVSGYIVAKLAKRFINDLLNDFNTQTGYLEVIQSFSGNSITMLKVGDQSLKPMSLMLSKVLKNTPWKFNFWPAEQVNNPPLDFIWLALLLLIAGVLLIVSSMLLLFFVIKNYKEERYVSVPQRQESKHKKAATHDSADIQMSDDVTDIIYNKGSGISVDEETEIDNLEYCTEKIFRAYDIRGVIGKCVNTLVFKQIGYGIAVEMNRQQQTQVAVGYDGRSSSPALVKAVTSALLESGVNVLDIGMVTSPMLYFAALTKTDGNGLIVTASHNPANYNGLKLMLKGQSYSGEQLQELRKIVLSDERISTENKGKLSQEDILSDYSNKITSNVILARPLKIVIDSGNGVTGKYAQALFEQLGCKVSVLNDDVDGDFPVHDPDPSRPENMEDLIKQVEEDRADLGLAFDGDGDRIGLISSAGEIIWPDRLLMLLAKDILSRHKNATILYDVKSSGKIEGFVKELGGNSLMCASGHSFMKSKLIETEALLAGEMSGHIFIKERWFGFDDAFFVAARILEILSIDLRKSRQVFAELPDSINTPEILVAADDGKAIMEKLCADLSVFEQGKIITIDGLRVGYKDGWGLVRSSNTTDNLTLRFEADDEQALQRIATLFKDALLAIDNNLEFPF